MDFKHLVIFSINSSRRAKLGARDFRILLNKLGIGDAYRKSADIRVLQEFLVKQQFTVPEVGAVKIFFRRIGKDPHIEGAARGHLYRITPKDNSPVEIGYIAVARNGDLSYMVSDIKGENIDYNNICQRAIDLYDVSRPISAAEIYAAAERIIGTAGVHDGPVWLLSDNPEAHKKLKELAHTCHEWRYDTTFLPLAYNEDIPGLTVFAGYALLKQIKKRIEYGRRVVAERYAAMPETIKWLSDNGYIEFNGPKREIHLAKKEPGANDE